VNELWIDQARIRQMLAGFFDERHSDVTRFGSTVNQTFEAFVFAAVTRWYQARGWQTEFVHPGRRDEREASVRLKFSTRGRPDNYTYVRCRRGRAEVQIRHQLRVATFFHQEGDAANVCLDVAVIRSTDLGNFSSDMYVHNRLLITFGEAKHMSAFAEAHRRLHWPCS
jgi:hypothetical protein